MFEDFFQSSSPADYAKMVINTKNADENKENVKEIENRILDLEDRIKKKKKIIKKKKKSVKGTLEIIRKIHDYNKNAQNLFYCASKVDKRKSKPKFEKIIAKRAKLRRQKFNTVNKKERKYKQ